MYGYAEFLTKLSEEQVGVLEYIDELLRTEFHLSRAIKYKVPFYEKVAKKPILYLNPLKNGNLEMCFWSGENLVNEFPRLEMRGRKMICGHELNVNEDLDLEFIKEVVHLAIELRPMHNIRRRQSK